MQNAKSCVLALAACVGGTNAVGDVTATTTCGTAVPTWVESVGKWDVSVSATTACNQNPIYVTIRGATSDRIRNVYINAQANQLMFISITGPTDNSTIASVDVINSTGSISTVLVSRLRVSGDVHRIIANGLYGATINGTITDYID